MTHSIQSVFAAGLLLSLAFTISDPGQPVATTSPAAQLSCDKSLLSQRSEVEGYSVIRVACGEHP